VNNWNVGGNWNVANYPGFGASATDTATFGATGTAASETVNNEVSVNTTLGALNYTNTASGAWHVTDIPAGVALTVNGPTIIGGYTVNSLSTSVGFVDAGTLVLNGNLSFGVAGTSGNDTSTLDLSSLSNFVCNAGATGTVVFGTANYSVANVKLAGVSNNITAATLNDMISASSSSSSSTLSLGSGTNLFNVANYNMGYGRDTLTVSFAGGTGGLRIRGTNGTDTSLANLTLGYHNTSGSGSHAFATLNLNGGPVDLRLGTLTLGQSGSTPTALSYGEGYLEFDTGTIFASNVVMGINVGSTASSSVNYAQGIGRIDIGANGTFIIGQGGLSLVNQTNNFPANTACTGTVNLNGGALICSNSILKTSTVGTGTLTMNGGSLDLVAGLIGTNGNPIDVLNLNSGTLHLNVNGSATTALVYGTSVSAGGMTLTIDSVAGVTVPTIVHLINYNTADGDPYSGFTLTTPLPGGYTGTLLDNAGSVDLSLTPPGVKITSLLWVGAVGATLNGNWNYTALNWLNTNGSPYTYTNPDTVHFDDTASNAIVVVATNFTPGALTFTNNGAGSGGLDYTLTGSGAIGGPVGLIKDGSGSVTLAESGGDSFSGGLTVVNGTVVLDDANCAISGAVAINNGATLQIGNNDANGALPPGGVTVNGSLVFEQTTNLLVTGFIAGTGTVTQNGGGSLTLSANNAYTGNTMINSGTLALTGAGSISNSPQVTVGNATLDVSAVTGSPWFQNLSLANSTFIVALTNQQPVSLFNGLTLGGPVNTVDVTSLPAIASYPTTLTLLQTAGGISGFNLALGTLPAGYHGGVSESADTTAVLLTLTSGPVGVRPDVLWSGVAALNTGNTNWSEALNWQLPGAPAPSDLVIFAAAGAASGTPFNSLGDGVGGIVNPAGINNCVNTSFTIGTLAYTNVGGLYQNTLIAGGAALTVTNTGGLTVGSGSVDFGASKTAFVTIAGTNGTLNVNNTNGVLFVGIGDSSGQATLDMSGLGAFNASVSTFLVGVGSGSEGMPVARESGVVYLALTNVITASGAVATNFENDTIANAVALDIGDDDGNAGLACALYLGQSNAIYADAIAIGRQKPAGTMEFNPNIDPNATPGVSTPSAWFRGASANSVANWGIGDQGVNSGSTENATGTADFTGGYVNALVGNLYVGRAAFNTSGSGTAAGTLTLDNGIFNVGALYTGYEPTNYSKAAVGTVNVNTNATLGTSGALSVSGSLYLGFSGGGGIAASGTLNINGGTVTVNSLVCGVIGTTNAVNLNGGMLAVSTTAGTAAAPIETLTLGGGTLQLNLNGAAGITNLVATTIAANAPTVLVLGSIASAAVSLNYPLISYTGADPYSSLTLSPLPSGYAGSLVDDTAHNLVSVRFTTVPNPKPAHITSVSLSGTTLNLTATNGLSNGRYVLLGATNLLTSLSQWTPLLTNSFNASGDLNLSTNIVNPALPAQFYLIEQ
jgi:autotransporter-associated beta strand protein